MHVSAAPVPRFAAEAKSSIVVKAKRSIQVGEELTWDYHPGMSHRPDVSLYIYGEAGSRGQALATGGQRGVAAC